MNKIAGKLAFRRVSLLSGAAEIADLTMVNGGLVDSPQVGSE
jgi:hypothetical protein